MDHSCLTSDLTHVGCKTTKKDHCFEARLSFNLFQDCHYRWHKIIGCQAHPPIITPVGLNRFLHQLGSSMPITNLDSCLFQPTQWCWLESSILTYDQSVLSRIWFLQRPSSQEVIRYILPVSEGLVNSLGYRCSPTDSRPHSNHHGFR